MLERRTYQLTELRAEEGDGKTLRIRGHAAVFGQKSDIIFGFREIVAAGAFAKSIKKDDIRALWNHDPNFVLGRKKSGTLSLKEDEQGLRTDIELPDTQFARDLYTSIKRGDVDQMSFGFRTITDKWRKDSGETIRELVEVDLFDVSPVTYPAYPQTDISARSFYEARMMELDTSGGTLLATVAEAITDAAATTEETAFLASMKARQEFVARRTPPPALPDPLSLSEIIKRTRIKT